MGIDGHTEEAGAALEAALVFDREGATLAWHLPAERTAVSLDDSRPLWEVLWAERARLGGVAHTHPWVGPAEPSATDLGTFAACEAGLGRRLTWVIATFSEVTQLAWVGPGRLDYAPTRTPIAIADLEALQAASGNRKKTDS